MKSINISLLLILAAGLLFTGCQSSQKKDSTDTMDKSTSQHNTLTDAEKQDGWVLLFDGESTDGWRGYKKDNFPKAWVIDDGALHIQGSGRGELGAEDGGDIIYDDKKFSDFHMKLEWKVAKGANSGIFYRGEELEEFDYIWKTAPEMQVLDNKNHPDAKLGRNGNRKSSSLYDLIPAQPQNANPYGEWNKVEVIAKGKHIIHKQNGVEVVEYNVGSARMDSLIQISKWAEYENWGDFATTGYIGLQDHGNDVWFRNIKIKEL